jgi:hypothetical protein
MVAGMRRTDLSLFELHWMNDDHHIAIPLIREMCDPSKLSVGDTAFENKRMSGS